MSKLKPFFLSSLGLSLLQLHEDVRPFTKTPLLQVVREALFHHTLNSGLLLVEVWLEFLILHLLRDVVFQETVEHLPDRTLLRLLIRLEALNWDPVQIVRFLVDGMDQVLC